MLDRSRRQNGANTASLAYNGGLSTRVLGIALCVAMLVILLGGTALWVWLDRVEALREAHSTALRLVHVLAEQTERTLQSVDLMLAGLADTLASTPDLPRYDPALQGKMQVLVQSSPFIRALFVLGADGSLTHDTNYPRTPPGVSVADRPYFRAHAERADLGMYVSQPLRSRAAGTWFVSVSRRIPTEDESFAGVVVASIEPRYFEQFYRGVALGTTDSIALFRRDGTLIARYPDAVSAIGTSYGSYEPFNSQLRTAPVGSFESARVIGGRVRMIAYRVIDDLPLMVTVGLDKSAVLANWRQRAVVAAAAAFGIALLGAAWLTLVIQRYRRRVAVEQRLAHLQKLDAAGQVAAGIVHDFRNLLAAVASGGRLLRRQVRDPALTPILDEMDAAVARGSALVSKLLAVSSQQELNLEVIDVNQLLRDLQPLMRSAAGSGVRLQLDLPPGVWPCRLDRAQFDRALLNLIVNARDAMPDGGELRVATANASRPARLGAAMLPLRDYVLVSVADRGPGMTRETARRALEPFFTTKGEAGTGLGLSQVYGFVRQVSGDLQIDCEPGAGTTVRLFFPRCAAVRPEPEVDHRIRDQAGPCDRDRQTGNALGEKARSGLAAPSLTESPAGRHGPLGRGCHHALDRQPERGKARGRGFSRSP